MDVAKAAASKVLTQRGLLIGRMGFHWSLSTLQPTSFLGLMFSGLSNVFVVRERGWSSTLGPERFLALAARHGVIVASALEASGVFMHSLGLLLDAGKILIIAYL